MLGVLAGQSSVGWAAEVEERDHHHHHVRAEAEAGAEEE